MTIIKIVLGLFGLGIVVFIHELGHFLAARLMGIDVDAFSIGWGKPILKKNIKGVEYRLGMFPLGGYCKMRGDSEFIEAWENRASGIKPVKGTFYGTSPWRRILVCFAGPLFNLLFAILVFSIIWGIGFEINTLENRIVLASDIIPGSINPADEAGLQTGDRIIEIRGRGIDTYQDIQELIATNPEVVLSIKVERQGRTLELSVRPSLERNTGAGRIGIYNWTDPLINSVAEGSPADIAGLQGGDRILKVNWMDFPYTVALIKILENRPGTLDLEFERNGSTMQAQMFLSYEDGMANPGIFWETLRFHTPRLNPIGALAKGATETYRTFVVSVRSLSLLFRGIDLTQAVSGPVRITYMMGEVAASGFSQGFGVGLSSMASFLSLISIALCIMNLLPIPIVDGGMIALYTVEGFRRKPLHPRAVQVFQTVGVVIIFSLMVFAVFGDILFLTRR